MNSVLFWKVWTEHISWSPHFSGNRQGEGKSYLLTSISHSLAQCACNVCVYFWFGTNERSPRGILRGEKMGCNRLNAESARKERRWCGAETLSNSFYLPCWLGWCPGLEGSAVVPWQLGLPLLHSTGQAPGPLQEGQFLPKRGESAWRGLDRLIS